MLGGEPIVLPPGEGVPPVRADGTLAGSALAMDRRCQHGSVGAGLAAAVAAATSIRRTDGRPDWAGLPRARPGT